MLPRATALALALALTLPSLPARAAENRCGWLQNPTPGNYWLDDSQATWILLSQGLAEEPLGLENVPDISEGDYVRTNGNYGYACACMTVDTESADGIDRIVAIYAFRQLPLAQCRNDAALPDPE